MSKKWIILAILVLATITYFVVSKMFPVVDEWVMLNILTPISTGLIAVGAGITGSSFWLTYVTPNLFWIGIIAGGVGMFFVYRAFTKHKLPLQKKLLSQPFQPQTGPPPMVVMMPQTNPSPPVVQPKAPEESKMEEAVKEAAQ